MVGQNGRWLIMTTAGWADYQSWADATRTALQDKIQQINALMAKSQSTGTNSVPGLNQVPPCAGIAVWECGLDQVGGQSLDDLKHSNLSETTKQNMAPVWKMVNQAQATGALCMLNDCVYHVSH